MSSFVYIILLFIAECVVVEGELDKNWHIVNNKDCHFKHIFGLIEKFVDNDSDGLSNRPEVVAFAFQKNCFYQLVAIMSVTPIGSTVKKFYCGAFEIRVNDDIGPSQIRSDVSIQGVIKVENSKQGIYAENTIELAMESAESFSSTGNWGNRSAWQVKTTPESEQSVDSCSKKTQNPILQRGGSLRQLGRSLSRKFSSSSIKKTSQTQVSGT